MVNFIAVLAYAHYSVSFIYLENLNQTALIWDSCIYGPLNVCTGCSVLSMSDKWQVAIYWPVFGM